jgi:hypothetical protein
MLLRSRWLLQGGCDQKNSHPMGRTAFDERELTVLISALLITAASLYFGRDLRRLPQWKLLLAGLGCLVVGGASTIAEHFVAYHFFNTLEHAAYMVQSLMLLSWALRARRVTA